MKGVLAAGLSTAVRGTEGWAEVSAAIIGLTRGVADRVVWRVVSLVEEATRAGFVAGWTPVPEASPARLAAAKATAKIRAGRMLVVVP